MIRLNQLKINYKKIDTTSYEQEIQDIETYIVKKLRIPAEQIVSIHIIRRSLDARKKDVISYIYTIDVEFLHEKKQWERLQHLQKQLKIQVSAAKEVNYTFILSGTIPLTHPPVIVGCGPAGIFCGLEMARAGLHPIILERGDCVEKRMEKVQAFWNGEPLDVTGNVQFGEGGAGTFSDGKLNTLVKDPFGRNKKVLQEFVKYGAPPEIVYMNKPHIGTDRLRDIVKNMREEIIRLGGQVRFVSQVTDIQIEHGKVTAVEVNRNEILPCEVLVLAIGHSARDTFSVLYEKELQMEQKPFAIGVRVEHHQKMIGYSQYGEAYKELPPADYKLTHQTSDGRGVYSFCMCPGGYVVNASSEKGYLAVNGMSNYKRNEKNANSAIVVSVRPNDFDTEHPLAGVEFQRKWERAAYEAGNGSVPVQLYGDFCKKRISTQLGDICPNIKGRYQLANLSACLPPYVYSGIVEGMEAFGRKIKGFSNPDTVLSGVETRTSSPVRICRNEDLESNIIGIYPCGEGAGYAGGITSAAIDGLKVFEAVAKKYYFPV